MRTHLAAIFTLLLLGLVPLPAEVRTFIDQSGRSLQGELVSVNGEMVTIKRVGDGLVFTVKAANFSQADQAYFASKGGGSPSPAAATSTPSATPPPSPASGGPPMRLEAKVYPNKSDRPTNYYYDERTARVGFRVEIRNGEQQRSFSGGTATMIAFAKNLQDSAESKVISYEEFPVSLEPLKSMSHDTKEVKLTYDNIAYKFGYKYSGYLLVLRDQTGKIVTTVGSSTTVEKAAEALLKLKVDESFDKSYKRMEASN